MQHWKERQELAETAVEENGNAVKKTKEDDSGVKKKDLDPVKMTLAQVSVLQLHRFPDEANEIVVTAQLSRN